MLRNPGPAQLAVGRCGEGWGTTTKEAVLGFYLAKQEDFVSQAIIN